MSEQPTLPNPISDGEPVLAELFEEMTNLLQAGNRVDLQEYIAKHPEHEEPLRRFLPAIEVLVKLGQSAVALTAPDEPGAVSAATPLGELGDFRVLREIGRGGMGIVYEAEQISLSRRVALKVLPFASALDAKHLQRFKNEAQAAGHLHHTNIVPVFAVGCERGVHYYAMQFIEGQTLAEVIKQLQGKAGAPDPRAPSGTVDRAGGAPCAPELTLPERAAADTVTGLTAQLSTQHSTDAPAFFRAVANWGIQAAEALEHGHQLGVVHRDVKPANLLLDVRGNLWITDFGLAHCQSHAALTLTGDLVGTLRYMSPEQALAKRAIVGHRSDIYSLGVTLYELLTLEPAFADSDRQELLRQIAFAEPQRPRRLNKAIPPDLETIVLKAMEKNPAERYATAQALAEDLGRHLRDDPIQARRPTVVQRLRKWSRRRRSMVMASAAVLLLTILLVAGNGLWWLQKRAVTAEKVEAALAEAQRQKVQGNLPEGLSAARRAGAIAASGTVDTALRLRAESAQADLEMLVRLEDIRLQKAGMMRAHDWDYVQADAAYEEAFRIYGIDVTALPPEDAAERMKGREVRVELAAALSDWGASRWATRSEHDEYWKSLLALAAAADPDPWRNELRAALGRRDRATLEKMSAAASINELPASTIGLFGVTLREAGALPEAITLLRKGQQQHPADFWINYELAVRLARSQASNKQEALRFFSVALALRPRSPGMYVAMSAALTKLDQLDEALAAAERAIDLQPEYATAHANRGAILERMGRLEDAMAACKQALQLQANYATPHRTLGNCLVRKGQFDAAVAAYRIAIRLRPQDADAYCCLGSALEKKNALDDAIAASTEAIRLKPEMAEAHNNLGAALARKGNLDAAAAACKEAIRLKPNYASAYNNLGNILQTRRKRDEAIAAYKEAIRLKPNYAEAHNNLGIAFLENGLLNDAVGAFTDAVHVQSDYGEAYNNLGVVYNRVGNQEAAAAAFHQALRINPDDAGASFGLGVVLAQQGQFLQALPTLRRGHELGCKRPGWSYPSAQVLRHTEQLARLDRELPAILAGQATCGNTAEQLELGSLCKKPYKRLYAASARFYEEAFAAEPKLAEDLGAQHRYNAACAAALAGCGQGEDAATLDDSARAERRQQALAWLRADLAKCTKQVENGSAQFRIDLQRILGRWQKDADLAGVRGETALVKLPEAERRQWQMLWTDVENTLAKIRERIRP
jgi:tetratricopeptide (TPR) repeat protein